MSWVVLGCESCYTELIWEERKSMVAFSHTEGSRGMEEFFGFLVFMKSGINSISKCLG